MQTKPGVFSRSCGDIFVRVLWRENLVFLRKAEGGVCGDPNRLVFMGSSTIYSHVRGDQNRYLKPNPWCFPNPDQVFLWLNLSRAWAQHCNIREIYTNIVLQNKETSLWKMESSMWRLSVGQCIWHHQWIHWVCKDTGQGPGWKGSCLSSSGRVWEPLDGSD